MKKTVINIFFALAIICCAMNHAYAQNTEKGNALADKFMIGITGGTSTPFGNFTSTDYGGLSSGFNKKSGFAGVGKNFGVTGTLFLTKHFGISALASYQRFSAKGLQQMVLGTQDAFDVDSASVTVKGSNHTVSIMVGPSYSIPLYDKLFIDVRALGGLVAATFAGNDIWLEDSGNLFNFSQKVSNAATAGFQGGAALRYTPFKYIAVVLSMDYFYSRPNFTIDNVNRNNSAGRYITTYNQPIMGLNTNVSLVCQFKK